MGRGRRADRTSAPAVLAALAHVRGDTCVIMDGVPEDETARSQILAAATVLRLDTHGADRPAGRR